jgi:hypothetical protein
MLEALPTKVGTVQWPDRVVAPYMAGNKTEEVHKAADILVEETHSPAKGLTELGTTSMNGETKAHGEEESQRGERNNER